MEFNMKIVVISAITLFAILAFWFGFTAYNAHQNDMEQHATLNHAISLAEGRTSQAYEFFLENREHFQLLSQSAELKLWQVTFLPNLIISMADYEMWRPHEWNTIPWMTEDILESIMVLLYSDIPGARDLSIIFHGDSMDYTIFGTPLHAILYGMRPHAWVVINYGSTYPREDRRVVSAESIEDGFYITITSEIPRHEARIYVFLTVFFFILTLATIAVLIWGIKTYRFMSDRGTTTKTILIMIVFILLLFFVSYMLFRTIDI
jgi:hypothetical protein